MLSTETEVAMRSRLGIPSDAERVLLFTESSHWDPDWLLTSQGYFTLRVRRNLDQAITALIEDPRRVYSVECIFFLKMYWDRCPDRREAVMTLINQGRLRLMGSGVTTPDTIIPSPEALVRDYLIGQEWLRDNGIDVEPEVAYFPDSFGHSPGMPALMSAVGVRAVAVCRIDGMFFLGCETDMPSRFPWPGTSAEHLSKREKAQDFIWRGPDGSEVLAHWVAFGYGQGELLAHIGATRVAGAPLALRWRTDRNVAHKVEKFVRRLAPLARTPYMLCPIGFDFSTPIPRLLDLLDRYNERHYPMSGTWVVNAGLDDYLSLVGHHRDTLPVVDFDPNPYFSGFLTSRSTVKRHARELVDTLVSADAASLAPGAGITPDVAQRRLAEPWWVAATSNHHDFITGTAPDRVVQREQMPWLRDATRAARAVLDEATGGISGEELAGRTVPAPDWHRKGSIVTVDTPSMTVVFDEEAGGCITSVTRDGTGVLGDGPGFDVSTYLDTGGLWRMGFEFALGKFEKLASASQSRARVEVSEPDTGLLEIRSVSTLDGNRLVRSVWIDGATERISMRCDYLVPEDRCVVAEFPLLQDASTIVTDVPGGVVERPARRRYDPTFWSVQTFAHVRSPGGDGTAVFLGMPGAVCLTPATADRNGSLAVVMARNAAKERILRYVPIPGFPARGHDAGPHGTNFALAFTSGGGWRECGIPCDVESYLRSLRTVSPKDIPMFHADSLFSTDNRDVRVIAAKKAHRGDGIVVRLAYDGDAPAVTNLRWKGRRLVSAHLCDGRERDVEELTARGESVPVPVSRAIASVRLVPK